MSVLCPRCEVNEYTPYGEPWEPGDPFYPALSRQTRGENDAPIYVCSPCGQEEAMEEFFGGKVHPGSSTPVTAWPVRKEVMDGEE